MSSRHLVPPHTYKKYSTVNRENLQQALCQICCYKALHLDSRGKTESDDACSQHHKHAANAKPFGVYVANTLWSLFVWRVFTLHAEYHCFLTFNSADLDEWFWWQCDGDAAASQWIGSCTRGPVWYKQFLRFTFLTQFYCVCSRSGLLPIRSLLCCTDPLEDPGGMIFPLTTAKFSRNCSPAGDIDHLKKQHEQEMVEFQKQQEVNKARMEQGLQEKLRNRRSRRRRQDIQDSCA